MLAGLRRTLSAAFARTRKLVLAAALALTLLGVVAALASNQTEPYATYEQTVASDGPAAQYRFDEAAGATTLSDSAGTRNATNSAITLGGGGPFGGSQAGSFNGSTSVATIPSTPLAAATEFSAEAWVNWTGGASYNQRVFYFGSSNTSYMFLTPASSATGHPLRFEIRSSSTTVFSVDATTLAAAGWHYVAVTEDTAGTLRLYLDGALAASQSGATISPATLGATTNSWLGKSRSSTDPLFSGSLSNVAFYTRALTAAQIQAHWNAANFPVNQTLPQLTGTAQDGQTLTTSDGSWSGLSPISFGYQWQRCDAGGVNCADLSGATSATYALTSPDVGQRLQVKVTGTNSAGNSTASSAPTATVAGTTPANTAAPSLSGTAAAGQTLTADKGSWSGTTPLGYAYQWQRCDPSGANCADITGATQSIYALAGADVGQTVRVVVSASNVAGSTTKPSPASAVVTGGAPTNVAPPTISGSAQDGQPLTGDAGRWSGATPISYAYQWRRCDSGGASCADIAGATGSTYAVGSADVGQTLRLAVTATNAGGSTTASSAATAVVAATVPANTRLPTLVGTPEQGQTMIVHRGAWDGTTPLTYTYQWRRCDPGGSGCVDIAAATKTTYVVVAADVGNTLRAVVTAANSASPAGVSATSAASGVAVPAAAGSCTDVWNGRAGDTSWSTAGNWSASRVPNLTDRACAASGASIHIGDGASAGSLGGGAALDVSSSGTALTLTNAATPSTIDSLTWHGGGIALTSPLTITSQLRAIGDTGAWMTEYSGGTLIVGPQASATVSGGTLSIDGATFRNEGTLTYSSGQIAGDNAALLDNPGTLVLNNESNPLWYYPSGTRPQLRNTGIVSKDQGSGTTTVEFGIDNEAAGTVDARVGTLRFTGGGGQGNPVGGGWIAEAGATVDFGGGSLYLGQSAQLTGHVLIDGSGSVTAGSLGGGAALEVSSNSTALTLTDAATPSTIDSLSWHGGGIALTSPLTVASRLDAVGSSAWMTEYAGSTLIVAAAASATVSGGTLSIDGATFRNQGTLTYTGGQIAGDNAALLDNPGTLVLNNESNPLWYYPSGTRPQLRNTGVIRKSQGSGTTTVEFAVDNEGTGTIDAQTGTLRFTGGGGSGQPAGGSWQAESGATVDFNGGSFYLGQSAQLTGHMLFDGGDATAGSIHGGALEANVNATFLTLTDSQTGSTVDSLTWRGGGFGGAGPLTVASRLDAVGSSAWMTAYAGSTLIVAPTASATVSGGTLYVDGATLRNEGTLTYTGGQILADKAALIDDPGTITLNGAGDAFDVYPSGSLPQLQITGTLRKADTTTTTVKIPVDNHGTVDVEAGALGIASVYDPQCSLTSPTGAWEAGGVLTFGMTAYQCLAPVSLRTYGDGEIDIDGGTISTLTLDAPDGNIAINGGTLDLEGTSAASTLRNLKLFSGTLTGSAELDICGSLYWTGGTMSGTGKTVLCPTNVGTIGGPSGGTAGLDGRVLDNRGDLTWGSGSLLGGHSAMLSNGGVLHANSESGSMDSSLGGATAQLKNLSTMTKDVGGAETQVCFLVTDAGSHSATSGTLTFCGQHNGRPPTSGEEAQSGSPCRIGQPLETFVFPEPSLPHSYRSVVVNGVVNCSRPVDAIVVTAWIDGVPVNTNDECVETDICGVQGQRFISFFQRNCVPVRITAAIANQPSPLPVEEDVCVDI